MPSSLKAKFLLPAALLLTALAGLLYFSLLHHPIPRESQPGTYLESFFKDPALYEEAFARAGRVPRVRITAGIVTHHFLARDLMAEFFAGIDPAGVKHIIVLGPDHFRTPHRGPEIAFTSLLPWKTPFGPVEPHRELLAALVARGYCALNDTVFMRDHGIYVLVPFIKKTFPGAQIVALVLRPGSNPATYLEFGRELRRLAPDGTIMLLSSDFAHGVTASRARSLDWESLAALKELDGKNLSRITCDCRPGLAVLLGYLGRAPKDFWLVNNQTARDFGEPQPDNLTSYITAYYLSAPRPVRLLFLGDLMFDRGIRKVARREGNDYIFTGVKPLLFNSDLAVANLEGPITASLSVSENASPNLKNHYLFTFDPGLARTLGDLRIGPLNLGNNHLLDFGQEGLAQTEQYLARAGVDYFGAPGNPGKPSLIKEVGGLKIGLVNFNQFGPDAVEATLAEIAGINPRADFTVVYAHWGAEYRHEPGSRLRHLARLFIDAGADLIIGSHPHVVQEKELYRGKPIYYSLGNFVFDQYNNKEACRGLAVLVTIDPASRAVAFAEIPLELEQNGQTRVRRLSSD